MDFSIAKKNFNSALRQILLGFKSDSGEMVDLTADRGTLSIVVKGTSVEVPIAIQTSGSASVPISIIAAVRKISRSYKDKSFRIRIVDRSIRLQASSFSHDGISMRRIACRVIDIPEEARKLDLLSLPFIFSVDEIEECGYLGNLLEAQKDLAQTLDSVAWSLARYGFSRSELLAMTEAKIRKNTVSLRKVLFPSE
jgi:hypothetical protein